MRCHSKYTTKAPSNSFVNVSINYSLHQPNKIIFCHNLSEKGKTRANKSMEKVKSYLMQKVITCKI